jgi:hypothetical protein
MCASNCDFLNDVVWNWEGCYLLIFSLTSICERSTNECRHTTCMWIGQGLHLLDKPHDEKGIKCINENFDQLTFQLSFLLYLFLRYKL